MQKNSIKDNERVLNRLLVIKSLEQYFLLYYYNCINIFAIWKRSWSLNFCFSCCFILVLSSHENVALAEFVLGQIIHYAINIFNMVEEQEKQVNVMLVCLYLCLLIGLTLKKNGRSVFWSVYRNGLSFLFSFFFLEKMNIENENYFLYILLNGHAFMKPKEKFRKIEIRRN